MCVYTIQPFVRGYKCAHAFVLPQCNRNLHKNSFVYITVCLSRPNVLCFCSSCGMHVCYVHLRNFNKLIDWLVGWLIDWLIEYFSPVSLGLWDLEPMAYSSDPPPFIKPSVSIAISVNLPTDRFVSCR